MKKLFNAIFVSVLFLNTANAAVCTDFDENMNIIEYECSTQNNIDSVDKNGNTALCKAVLNDDVETYIKLKSKGADTSHKCIQKIPTEQYEQFINKVSIADKSWSFLGLGKLAWGVIGTGVAVGAGVAAMSGGGGGGSSKTNSETSETEPEGTEPEEPEPQPEPIITIPCQDRGYTYRLSDVCPEGYVKNNADHCNNNDGTGVWFKCDTPKPCDSDYYMSCPSGYEESPGDVCLSGTNVYKKCVRTDACHDYNYYSSSQCPAGYTIGSSCISGYITKYKCDQVTTCPYDTTECVNGYVETGNICYSGDNVYKQCKPDPCEGYDVTDASQCMEGWTIGSSCLSGTTVKYKCDAPVQCPYTTTSCQTGFYETETCKSGNDKIYVKCELIPLDCVNGVQNGTQCSCDNGWTGTLCEIPESCNGYQTSCEYGYMEIANDTCQSGNTQLVKCVFDEDNFIQQGEQIYNKIYCQNGGVQNGYSCSCPEGWTGELCTEPVECLYTTLSCADGYVESGNTCKSGNTVYKECEPIQCGTHASWTPQGCQCENGYENLVEGVGCSLKILSCGAHAYQDGTHCECDSGYENWTEGSGCSLKLLDCGTNAYQSGTQCLCDYGYEKWVSGKGCSLKKLNCGKNAHQEGTQCLCDDGYKNLTSKGCSLDAINCGAHAYQKGTQCECDSGYENWTEGSGCTLKQLNCGVRAYRNGDSCYCNSGYTDWTEGYGCYLKRNCGDHAHQKGNSCECDTGFYNWVSGVGCSVYGQNTSFSTGKKTINSTDSNSVTGTTLYADKYSLGGSSYQVYDYTAHNAGLYITKTNTSSTAADVTGVLGCSIPNTYNYKRGVNATAGGLGIISINKTGKGNIYGLLGTTNVNLVAGDNANGYIVINNSGSGDIFGVKSEVGARNVAFYYESLGVPDPISTTLTNNFTESYGLIDIQSTDNGNNVTGLYGREVLNIESADEKTSALIRIRNEGSGNVYGGYSFSTSSYDRNGNVYISSSAGLSGIKGTIAIDNFGNGEVTGLYNSYYNTYASEKYGSLSDISGDIIINNSGSGNSYGIYNTASSSSTVSNAVGGTATITINNKGVGNAYGIYANGKLYNANTYGDGSSLSSSNYYNDDSLGTINIINYSGGKGFGLYGYNQIFNEQGTFGGKISRSEINMQNLGNGTAIGIYGTYTPSTFVSYTINNSGYININNVGSGTAIGIFGDKKSKIINSGVINIVRDTYVDMDGVLHSPSGSAGDVFGIYAKSGSSVENTGTINIKSDGTMYGIYVEENSTVTNTGIITLNGVSCDNSTCSGQSDYDNYIVLNGSTLYNAGAVKANALSLAPMQGKVVARSGSKFVIDNELSGDLHISNDIVANGNQTTYIAENMIEAGDTSGLNLVSDSAMFDASLVGTDVIMQMKDFDSLTDNKSLATFLKNNYDMGKGSDLFAKLKSVDNVSAFNSALMGLSGLDSFNQFAHEDLSAMREISLSMNNKLFENSDRDNFDISDSMGYFSFSDNHNTGSGQYGISSSKMSDNWKLGYGMAMANIYTSDGDGFNRQNQMWMFYMPATYTNDDIELVITSQAGFTRGRYNRRGFNNQNYEGYIEKQIVGLMNDLRYPITFGNWTLAPDMAFNAIMYNQSGHEDEHEFSLIIPNERMVSVETGLGLYSKYDKTLQNGGRLKFTSGIMGYREYGDTYNIKLGMRGMDGSFDLYNNDYKYRAALNMGIDYSVGNFHVYGDTQYFMDNSNYMNFKGGVSYRF